MDARLAGISFHLPDRVVTNEQLQAENPDWDMARIESKTGIKLRHIAAEQETASDLAFLAAQKLLDGMQADRSGIDCLMLCTQSPDYFLPTTACLLQDRLGLPTRCAAFDFNQGCSGYVYGLYLAKALVSAGMAANVLLLTAETYSKFIHPRDRSVRVLFGDGASASLIHAGSGGARIGNCRLGTDGKGFRNLIVPAGAARLPCTSETKRESADENGCVRTEENLYMDGQELFAFTLARIPALVRDTLAETGLTIDDVDWFVFHQANAFMNEHLRARMRIPKEKAPLCMQEVGNTVSSTIPITLHRNASRVSPGQKVLLVGFGVGYSWGACLLDWNPLVLA